MFSLKVTLQHLSESGQHLQKQNQVKVHQSEDLRSECHPNWLELTELNKRGATLGQTALTWSSQFGGQELDWPHPQRGSSSDTCRETNPYSRCGKTLSRRSETQNDESCRISSSVWFTSMQMMWCFIFRTILYRPWLAVAKTPTDFWTAGVSLLVWFSLINEILRLNTGSHHQVVVWVFVKTLFRFSI